MKKLLLLMLALIVALSLIACDDTSATNDDGDDSDGETTVTTGGVGGSGDEEYPVAGGTTTGSNGELNKGDGDEGTTSTQKPGTTSTQKPGTGFDDIFVPNAPAGAGLELIENIASQLEKTASMKIAFSMDMVANIVEWTPYGAENINENGVATFVVTIAKGENGYNLMIEADARSGEVGSELDIDLDGVVLYVIDGIVYEYNAYDNVYYASPIEADTDELEAMLGELMGEIEISEEEMSAVIDTLGALVIDALQIENGKGSFAIDFKAMYDQIVAYIDSIDVAKDTLRILIDEALALVDPSLSVGAIMQSVAATMNMTVGDFLVHFEQTYGMTMQELYDSLVNDPQVQAFIVGLATSEGLSENEIAQILYELTSLKLDTLFTAEIKALTMYQFAMIMMDADMSTQPSLGELLAAVNAIIDMPLQSLEAEFGIPFSSLKLLPSLITMRECKYTFDISFVNGYEIDEAVAEGKIDITVTMPSDYVDGKMNIYSYAGSVSVKVYDIGDKEIVIELPKDAVVITAGDMEAALYSVK